MTYGFVEAYWNAKKSMFNVYRNKDGGVKHIKHVTGIETSATELDSKMYILHEQNILCQQFK